MAYLVTTSAAEIAGEAISSFSGLIIIGCLIVAIAAWELVSDIEGPQFKLLKKHLGLGIIPLFFIFILTIFVNPWFSLFAR
jgi:hypothetical protein